jgi:hypothetical protein
MRKTAVTNPRRFLNHEFSRYAGYSPFPPALGKLSEGSDCGEG